MNERGIPPPPPLGFIEDPQMQGAWWKWFTRIFYAVPKVQTFSKALTPTAVTAGAESVQTFTVTGLTTTDIVTVNKPTNQPVSIWFMHGYQQPTRCPSNTGIPVAVISRRPLRPTESWRCGHDCLHTGENTMGRHECNAQRALRGNIIPSRYRAQARC